MMILTSCAGKVINVVVKERSSEALEHMLKGRAEKALVYLFNDGFQDEQTLNPILKRTVAKLSNFLLRYLPWY